MTHHKQQGDKQGDKQGAQEIVQRSGLDQLDGGQGWRPPTEGGTESTLETAQGGDRVQEMKDAAELDDRGTGIYDSGQASRPSTEAGEFEGQGQNG